MPHPHPTSGQDEITNTAPRLTANDRRALDAIERHEGLRRTELTPGEKRTATRLAKLDLIALHGGWYVTTVVGRAALRSPTKNLKVSCVPRSTI